VRIQLIGAGTRLPHWVDEGYQEYTKRLPPECRLQLVEIPLGRRGKGLDPARALLEEGERMLQAVPAGARLVALDVRGQSWSTAELSRRLGDWLAEGRDLALLVGGPDGLAEACLARAEGRWSLSPLTFPHAMVRVILAEQLYRAWSLLQSHPYHRA
jgi:23S rRNA (pseudouridine1915-N3)-methyltransferase